MLSRSALAARASLSIRRAPTTVAGLRFSSPWAQVPAGRE